jgi:hypothetical protein
MNQKKKVKREKGQRLRSHKVLLQCQAFAIVGLSMQMNISIVARRLALSRDHDDAKIKHRAT